MSIRINYHDHSKNSGLGNKLFLNFVARALSMQNNESLCNWLSTRIYADKEDDYERIEIDKWGCEWRYVAEHNCSHTTTIGRNHNLGAIFGNDFHQSPSTVNLLRRYKHKLIRDFGERDGLFVHVRFGDLADERRWSNICNYEYYRHCISKVQCEKKYLSSDTFKHPFIQDLISEFNLEFYEDSPEETIIFGSRFKNKVLSLGTFSWWIGFIGSQNNIFCPDPKNYNIWHGQIFECMKDWNMVSKPYEKNN